ncbi:VanZ family protein [Microbacterium kyungheense]|uniref:Glycopeptide antibiotics resistance protein n=1 Tax=Microbacterium kyungheense TaxID=1263636 RepID=A0A543EU50_9MICO|nr:VanZ family protein [Microbacterium kyungheense]TQM25084.1 glycopeptide antibiotics resistance protein [Microbacterium kyungheense]
MTSSPRQPTALRRSILILAFAVYLALLAWVVLWKLEVPWIGDAARLVRPIKLVPFVPSGDAGASTPIEMLINLVLFLPFGLFLGALAPSWTWVKAGAAALGASLVLETVQHLISTGSFDTTDLIVNTDGALIGWGVFALVRRAAGERTSVVMSRVCIAVSALALVAATAFVVSPLHYGPQRDIVVERSTSLP